GSSPKRHRVQAVFERQAPLLQFCHLGLTPGVGRSGPGPHGRWWRGSSRAGVSLRSGPAGTSACTHAVNSAPLRSPAVNAIAALVGFPAAALVIAVLQRSPLRKRLVAAPSGDR